MSIEGFPITLRLTTSAQYQAVFDHSDYRVTSGPFLLLARHNHLNFPRLGLIVSKKNISLAVQRNRIKRLLREFYRRQNKDVRGLDIIIMVRGGVDGFDTQAVLRRLLSLWEKLMAEIPDSASAEVEILK